jgi:glycerol-3-phosphate acyltransferase PlsY
MRAHLSASFPRQKHFFRLVAQPNLLAAAPQTPIEHGMAPNAWPWLWPVAFYLVGSVPTGFLLGKARGLDIRRHGSGNIGATNVWRVMGWKFGLVAFASDFLKGFLLLFIVRKFCVDDDGSWPVAVLLVLCGIAAIIGHNYTPWLGFKGGKGIATSAGVLAALMPPVLGVSLSLWIVATLLTRTVSIGSLLAAASLLPAALFFYPGQWVYIGLATLAGGLAIWRHKANIQRLLAGTESKIEIGSKKKKDKDES